ncbi:MAG: hypothetical protein FIB02_04515 [Desulfuromonas sp.]|nr:hypothetical protein [Desulfuromonas sp.]
MCTNERCLLILVILISTLLLSGCIGLQAFYTTECSADLPIKNYIYNKDNQLWGSNHKREDFKVDTILTIPDKDDFIREWGEPDEIIIISQNEETLVYNYDLWCGVMPALAIGVPFVFPVCDGFDRITFKNNVATHVHFKRFNYSGAYFTAGGFIIAIPQNDCPSAPAPNTYQAPGGQGVESSSREKD